MKKMKKKIFREELDLLKYYSPGKPIEEVREEYGLDRIVKLASNENPLGPSPKAMQAIQDSLSEINIYPDAASMQLRKMIAEKHQVDVENIICGSGGEQLLSIITGTFINKGDNAIMVDTTFGLYETSVISMGGIAIQLPLKDMQYDLESMINHVDEKTKIIYICNPNNPTGNILKEKDIKYLTDNIDDDIVLVLDEAYYDYAIRNSEYPDSLKVLKKRPNTIILRTFSKVAGIAGIRVGYVITSKEIAQQMNKMKGVFNVNRLAQVAAIGALKDQDHIDKTVDLNYESLDLMKKFFEKMNFKYIETSANFIFVNIERSSKEMFEKLLKNGVIIRGGHLWGWNNWIRISSGTIEETNIFIKTISELID
jgi:histidinol-phosphate aminotransferase